MGELGNSSQPGWVTTRRNSSVPCAARKSASDSQFATFTHRYRASAETARCSRREMNPGWAVKYLAVLAHSSWNASSGQGLTANLFISITGPGEDVIGCRCHAVLCGDVVRRHGYPSLCSLH